MLKKKKKPKTSSGVDNYCFTLLKVWCGFGVGGWAKKEAKDP
jgi:hypothetical protein